MDIKVLVSCCSDYGLKETTEEVIKELGITATVEKIKDMQKIMAYGVMKAPAIVINEKVKAMGRVPSKVEIMKYIQDELNH
nr:thioredoxin family protein [uncultured Caproiciproducens sp.]